MVDLKNQHSQLMELAEQIRSLATQPSVGEPRELGCPHQPGGPAHPAEEKAKSSAFYQPPGRAPRSLAKWDNSLEGAQIIVSTLLHIPAKCFHLEESAFSKSRAVSWNISKQLQHSFESLMFLLPSSS